MAGYDFHQLSPHDLELLARDLLQSEWGIALESFKQGTDGGIDLRYASANKNIIVQCKHYLGSGLNKLLQTLRKEKEKVEKLQPSRYVLVTSVPLSPRNKKAIIEIIGADVLEPGDVFGSEDVNNLIGKHPNVERKHFKLWLASTVLLERVLHNAAITRIEFKVEQIYREARRYVQSNAFPRALSMLDEHSLAILAGAPGVGKTTLANLLLYAHLEKNYRPIIIDCDVSEGRELFQRGEPQIFYFDDFMGASFLGDHGNVVTGKNDQALLDFIAMVRETPKKRLILTTREHIYERAMNKSERLRYSGIGDLRVFLRISDYSFAQKARILYNHLYFSEIRADYREVMLRDNFFLTIIRHKKFNPRIIEWLTSYQMVKKVRIDKFRQWVQSLLSNPSEIWRHAYDEEVSDAARSMLLTVFSFGGKVHDLNLRAGFDSLHYLRAGKYGFTTRPEDFLSARREIASSFIKPSGANAVEFLDPSLLDLMNSVLREAPGNAVDIVEGAIQFDQIERVWALSKEEQCEQIASCILDHPEKIVTSVERILLDARHKSHSTESASGFSVAASLIVLIEMAGRLHDSQLSRLIARIFDRVLEQWESEGADIGDAIALLQAIRNADVISRHEAAQREIFVRSALLSGIQDGCRADELREVILAFDASEGTNSSLVRAIQSSFTKYCDSIFSDELGDCRSSEEFNGLRDDLEFIGEQLDLEIDWLLGEIDHAQDEFERYEDMAADYMMDEWKDRRYEEKSSEREIVNMFVSLRQD